MTRFCKSCGRQLGDRDRFCDRCRTIQSPEPPPLFEYPQQTTSGAPVPANLLLEPPQIPLTVQSPAAVQPTSPPPPSPAPVWGSRVTSPIPSPRPLSYVDVPISRHRFLFSYLGCPTAIIAMAFALLALVADGLPLATLTPGCWCFVLCTPMTTYCPSPAFQVNVFSLVPLFPLVGVVILGAVLVVLTPGLSLLARSYGRTVRSLMYILSGVFGVMALTAYRLFYEQTLPPNIRSSGLPVTVTLQFPFYLILTGSMVFVLIGVLEWIRLPRRLFRTYVPPPPKPPKPKRMPVPEVVPHTISSKPAVVEGLSLAPTAAVEPPVSQAKRPILTPSSTAQTSSLDKLTKLKELLDSGAITKEEYEEQKQMILESGEM